MFVECHPPETRHSKKEVESFTFVNEVKALFLRGGGLVMTWNGNYTSPQATTCEATADKGDRG